MQLFHALVDWFIPSHLKENSRLYTRSRMVASGAVMSWVVCIPILFILLIILNAYPRTQLIVSAITLGGICNWVIALYALRWFGSFSLCIHLLVGSGIASVAFAVFFTGGINSPVIVAMVVPPVLSAIFADRQSAMGWCTVASIVCFVFYLLNHYGLVVNSILPDPILEEFRAVFSVLACFLVVSMLYMYEAINAQFHELLEGEKQHFSTMAHHDDLTGLANRLQFNKRLNMAIDTATQQETKVALIYIDLDDFKPVNDNYGHEIGDQVLRIASLRMSQCVRLSDVVARLGGDEFGVILIGIDSRDRAQEIADHISESMTAPMEIQGHTIQIGSSNGVCLFPEDASDAKSLITTADANMYQLKEHKKKLAS